MPTPNKSAALEAVEAARARFSRAVREYRAKYGFYIDTAPPLTQDKIEGCRMFADRFTMLNSSLFPAGLVWAEVGVDKGAFSREILARTNPSKLHLIDLAPDRLERANIASALDRGVAEMHAGDSAEQLASFPDAYFDVIYIDGDHYYDGVKRDIAAARSKIKAHGLLVFNDYAAWSPGRLR
jgi:hypothetical protein